MRLTLAMTATAPGSKGIHALELEITPERIFLRGPEGRQAWIEVNEDGDLIVRAYNAGIEDPVNIYIEAERVSIMTDRESGTFRRLWCRSCGTGKERIRIHSGEARSDCPDCGSFNVGIHKL